MICLSGLLIATALYYFQLGSDIYGDVDDNGNGNASARICSLDDSDYEITVADVLW